MFRIFWMNKDEFVSFYVFEVGIFLFVENKGKCSVFRGWY